MPKSRNRKNHKSKVNSFKNKQRENRNNIKKWLTAIQEINKGQVAIQPDYNYVSGNAVGLNESIMLTPTPEITNTNYE